MSRATWEDDSDRDEFNDEFDADDERDIEADMTCPSCGGAVIEDAQKCPHCGDWITPADRRGGGVRRWLFVVAVGLMLLAMLRFLL